MTYKIIQLGHPGGEWPRQGVNGVIRSKLGITWNVDRFSGTREWNIRDHHYRKFILAEDVEYIDDLKSGPKKGKLTFWGEWEAHSKFEIINKSAKDFYAPRLMHYPYFQKNYDGLRRHTTDPVVFGESFWFTHCKQSSNKKQVKQLGENSIIIWGSERIKDKKFLVDTIFVVKNRFSQEYVRKNLEDFPYLLKHINLCINDGHDLLTSPKRSDLAFYKGKSYGRDDIFSYVPAKIYDYECQGHNRLILDTRDKYLNLQSAGSSQAHKIVMSTGSFEEIKAYWEVIATKALKQGFVLAVNIPWPKIVD